MGGDGKSRYKVHARGWVELGRGGKEYWYSSAAVREELLGTILKIRL